MVTANLVGLSASLLHYLFDGSAHTPRLLVAVAANHGLWPRAEPDKVAFLDELHSLRARHSGPCLLCGDFNMVYHDANKSNSYLNHRTMAMFHRFIQDAELQELYLNGRQYTWSNEQRIPTMARIDHVFACVGWCELFPSHCLCANSTKCSDPFPLLLHTNAFVPHAKRFRFEMIWSKFPGFLDAVREGWGTTLQNVDACTILDFKFHNTAKALKRWSQKFVGNVRLQLAIANEVPRASLAR
jgi:hypothetical protein